jgi:hypothetical protein
MPYVRPSGVPERANRLGHRTAALDPAIRHALARYDLPPAEIVPAELEALLVPADELPDYAVPEPLSTVAVDGSPQEVEVRPDFPSARVGYVQVAGVWVDLRTMLARPANGFVDPEEMARASVARLLNGVLPTSVVTFAPGQDAHTSWRHAVEDLFRSRSIEDSTGSTSLAAVLCHILGEPDNPVEYVELKLCPQRLDLDCPGKNIEIPVTGGRCENCHSQLFLTDVLRLYEAINEEGPNAEALGRLMSVLEVLVFLWQIRSFAKARGGRVLSQTAFVLDGPLSVFGQAAGLKRYALSFLQALHQAQTNAGRPGLPIVVGLEKTGRTADHAKLIVEHVPRRHLVLLPDSYIYHRIQPNPGRRAYGYDTDFGRRFLYRTLDGRMLVLSVPPLPSGTPIDDADTVNILHYPTLKPTLAFLDRVGTMLYTDAVIPVALAHNFAALPLGVGSSVLRTLAQDSLGLPHTIARDDAGSRNH